MHLLSVFSLRNRALIALVTIVVGIFGGVALTSLKQELIPSLSLPQLFIVTAYPGASPQVVSDDVSAPIENAIQSVPGLESTNATSQTNASTVTASFAYGTDITTAEQKVQLAINRIGNLPDGVEPRVLTFSFSDLPVIQIAITSDLEPIELANLLENSTLPDIRDIEGVSDAALLGATTQRVSITPNAEELDARGLRVQSIRDALDASGSLLPSGEVTEDGTTLTVQAGTKIETIEAIQALPLLGATKKVEITTPSLIPGRAPTTTEQTVPDDELYTLSDFATVEVIDNPVTGISRVNGEPSVTIAVTKSPAGNTVEVSRAVTELIPELEASLGNNTTFTVVFDQAPFIEKSIESLTQEGLLGLVFAVLVIFLFLFSFRSTLVAAVSIPVSVLITFIGMLVSGYTLNIITLGALTIAIGRVVDDSIVVIENIKRHLTLGQPKLQAIKDAVREVAGAVTSSTITTIAVFLPLALVSDVTGELFRPFALTTSIALAASLFVSLTIVPVLAYWFLGSPVLSEEQQLVLDDRASRSYRTVLVRASITGFVIAALLTAGAVAAVVARGMWEEQYLPFAIGVPLAILGLWVGVSALTHRAAVRRAGQPVKHAAEVTDDMANPTRLQRAYLPIIRWSLKWPAVVLIGSVALLAATVPLAFTLKTNFLSDSGQNTLSVSQSLPRGTSLEAKDAAAMKVEEALASIDGIDIVQLSLGSGGASLAAAFGGGSNASFSLTTDPDFDQVALQADVRDAVAGLTDVGEVTVAASGGGGGGFGSSVIAINIKAPTDSVLRAAADDILSATQDLGVTAEATSNLSVTQPYIEIKVDRSKAAESGLTEISVGRQITEAMNPTATGSVVIDEKTLSIYIKNTKAPLTQEEIRAFIIQAPGDDIRLDTLAEVSVVEGPSSITAIKGIRSATVSVTPNSDDVGSASAAVAAAVESVDLPAGASAELGGVTSQQSDAFSQLGLALLIAILIVYVVMVATFKSLRQPLLLLISVPFAATGAVALQLISDIPLGVPSIIGALMLIGIVVTNAIVLVDLINQYRERGMKVAQATIYGAARRLRPILMTAFATIFALLPLGIGITGSGGFISQPLAIIVIGGLISSTLLTLIVLPALYYVVEGARERKLDRLREKKAAREGVRSGVDRIESDGLTV
ncbi:MAG: efflux RND transporter permease subunit [Microbacteriaceae bacterium]